MRGSITVFFSLIFVTIVSVLATTLESARWACTKLYMRQAAEDAVRSVFADYYRPLFEEYGVLFLDETYGSGECMVEEKLKEYISCNLNPNYGRLKADPFLYKSNMTEASVENKVSATDGMGAVFRRAACEYMKYRLPADFAKEFLAELDFFNRAEEVRNFFSQIQSIQKDLSEIDETVIRINDLIEDIRVLQQDATDIAAEVNELLLLKEPDKKQKKLLEDSTDALLGTKKSIMGAVEHILDSSGVYEKLAESVCTYLRGLADEWLSNNVSQNIKDIVLGEIDSLITYSGGNGDVYGIERNKDFLEGILEQLYMWSEDCTSGEFAGLDGIELELPNLISTGFKAFDVKKLWSEFCSDGFYSLICPGYGGLSDAIIEPFANRAYVWERAELYSEKESLVETATEGLVFQEYIERKFADFMNNKENTAIKYETEYIIAGKSVDRENIDSVIGRLLAVREGLNLIYLICNSQKKNEAHALAVACVGFTGVYVGVKALEYLILTVWALGEAMLDVRILMSGGSVPVVKGEGDWKLELDRLTSIGSVLSSVTAPIASGDIGYWCYGDYLHVFLYMQNKDEQVLRVMDLIEANIKKKYSTAFRMTNCVKGLRIKSEFNAKPVFVNNSFFDRECQIDYGYSY